MKHYVTPEMKLEAPNPCDVLTTSDLIAFSGRGNGEYKGERTHINSI